MHVQHELLRIPDRLCAEHDLDVDFLAHLRLLRSRDGSPVQRLDDAILPCLEFVRFLWRGSFAGHLRAGRVADGLATRDGGMLHRADVAHATRRGAADEVMLGGSVELPRHEFRDRRL